MSDELTPDDARDLAREAYLFGLPLVYIGTQIDVLTHVTKPEGSRAPLNQFAHYREFPDASNKTVVGFNVDTLYSLAQLDLSPEPIVLSRSGDGRPLLDRAAHRRLEQRSPCTRLTDRRRQGRRLRDHRARLARRAARRSHRAADADQDRPARWSHLHRRPGRLRRRARPPGPVQAGAAVGVGNRLHAARRGPPEARRARTTPVPAQVTAHVAGDLLQPAERTAGEQPARTGRPRR